MNRSNSEEDIDRRYMEAQEEKRLAQELVIRKRRLNSFRRKYII
jgi:hypothetical protein